MSDNKRHLYVVGPDHTVQAPEEFKISWKGVDLMCFRDRTLKFPNARKVGMNVVPVLSFDQGDGREVLGASVTFDIVFDEPIKLREET